LKEKPVPAIARRLIDAFLAGDSAAAAILLASDARFHSPIRDYEGADQIGSVWRAVAGVVQNAQPTSIHERDTETIAFFAGTIKDQAVDGVLRTVTDENNRVSDVTLMIRPWAALRAGIADVKL
jgi:SnoaL-like domain